MLTWLIAFLVVASALVYILRHRLVRLVKTPVVTLFHYFYYRDSETTWSTTNYLGVPIQKLPLDLWRYHDILWQTRPDVIVETGTNRGGSALFLAHLCDRLGTGRIITVDIVDRPEVPKHPRITYIVGSSTDPQIFAQVTGQLKPGERVMVALDSDHSRDHVVRELELYSPLVSRDCYLIVEDTNVNGHPVSRSHGPGPMEALEVFPWKKAGFEHDDQIVERYMVTFFPKGWLKRVSV
jgi:cephalosporin hydroxylase